MPHLRNQVLRLFATGPSTAKQIQQQINDTDGTEVTIDSVYKAIAFWADQGMIDVTAADYAKGLAGFAHLGNPNNFAATDAQNTTSNSTTGTDSIAYHLSSTGKQLLVIICRSRI